MCGVGFEEGLWTPFERCAIESLLPAFSSVALGVGAVLTHIEHAEGLFRQADEAHESQYLTDVLYRANHAFEGMLREALCSVYRYCTLPGADHSVCRECLAQAERYSSQQVIELFKNYRQNWRNPLRMTIRSSLTTLKLFSPS